MSELSYLWNGVATGDATLAPYAKDAFNKWLLSSLCNNDANKAFVVPGYLEDLKATISAGSMNLLTIRPGAAVIKNFIYISDDSEYFPVSTIQDTTMSYRFDSIVLQLDLTLNSPTKQTIRLNYLSGVESVSYPPTAPSLTQDTNGIWQIELFRILIDSTSYVLDQKYIYDLRYFLATDQYRNDKPRNLLRNSEFMGYFDLSGIVGAGVDIGGWVETGIIGTTTYATTAPIDPMVRGRSLSIGNCEVDAGIIQDVYLGNDKIVSVEGIIQPQDTSSPVLVSLIGKSGTWEELERFDILIPAQTAVTTIVRGTYEFTNQGVTYIELTIANAGAAGANFKVGQFLLTKGYFTGGFRPISEVVMFQRAVTSTSWDGDAKSTGTTTIDLLAATFGAKIFPYTKAIIVTLRCRDSGSAGAGAYGLNANSIVGGINHGKSSVNRITADKIKTIQTIVPVTDDLKKGSTIATMRFVLEVTASGAGTLDAWVEIVGIII